MGNGRKSAGITVLEVLVALIILVMVCAAIDRQRPRPVEAQLRKFVKAFSSALYECRKESIKHGSATLSVERNAFKISGNMPKAWHQFDDAAISNIEFWTLYQNPNLANVPLPVQNVHFYNKLCAPFRVKFEFFGKGKILSVNRFFSVKLTQGP
jgi:hypothetical protein